jgi:hypothetical protein
MQASYIFRTFTLITLQSSYCVFYAFAYCAVFDTSLLALFTNFANRYYMMLSILGGEGDRKKERKKERYKERKKVHISSSRGTYFLFMTASPLYLAGMWDITRLLSKILKYKYTELGH